MEQTYEGMFLVNAATAAEDWEGVRGTIERIMQRAEAEIIRLEKWDERRLCYSVSGQKRGTYILCYFKCQPGVIRKIERDALLNETILRVLILRADQIPQEIQNAPTPLAQAQQQKQAAKVTAGRDAAGEGGSDTDESIDSLAEANELGDGGDVSDNYEEVNEEDIPDILETFDDEEEHDVQEKSRADDIDETESLPG